MEKFILIQKDDIENALAGSSRQYLAGNLQKPQELRFVRSREIEIGITNYSEPAAELPHYHTAVTEFQYMISGWTQYLDTESGEIHEYKAGDFFVIQKNTTYAQKSRGGTRILFIKVPSVNDKNVVPASAEAAAWLSEKLKTVRTDHYHENGAPRANSIRPAAAVAIVNEGKILLLKRSDSRKWTMPGGTLEFGESLPQCALREVMEESGYRIEIDDVIGTYTDPNVRIEYSDGEVRQEFTVVYSGKILSGRLKLDEESTDYRWIDLNETDPLPMASSQKQRLEDVRKYIRLGEKSFR